MVPSSWMTLTKTAINGNSAFRALKMALKYLLDKQYNTDISELARIFGGEEQETNHPL